MSKFTIEVKGVAIVYPQDGMWKVIFPFKGCHDIKFSSDKTPAGENTPPKDVVLAAAERTIGFTLGDTVNSSFSGQGLLDQFVDLTADYAHGRDKLSMVKDWDKFGVLMEIPDAQLNVWYRNNASYQLVKGSSYHSFPKDQMAYWAKFEILSNSLTMRSTGEKDRIYTTDTKLTFNNDCEGNINDPHGDIKLVYEVIKSQSGGKLSMRRTPRVTPLDKEASASGNPQESENGLPCHITVLGDPPSGMP